MKAFDYYEFAGVLCPGVVVLYSISKIFPMFSPIVHDQLISVGTLGLFVVLSYVAGHLVQALGDLVEPLIWRLFGGIPTDWVRTRRRSLLTDRQNAAVEESIKIQTGKPLSSTTQNEWRSAVRSIYAAVANSGHAARIDVFNGNYGLFRGLATAFLICSVSVLASPSFRWSALVLFLACALLAIYRLRRFGIHYARELYVQFLQLKDPVAESPKEAAK